MNPNSPRSNSRDRILLAATALAIVVIFLGQSSAFSGEAITSVPAPEADEPPSAVKLETTVVAGGCFWGVQGVFEHVKGVIKAVAGYAGGEALTARYQDVGLGTTGHAESVEITFDPQQVTYGQLLQIYFSVAHDPTQLDRQGPDRGSQYRSTIFPTSEEQQKIALAYIAQINASRAFSNPLATRVEPHKTFYPAEVYHQDFLVHNTGYQYIIVNDLPKIDNLRRLFPDRFRREPVLVNPWPL